MALSEDLPLYRDTLRLLNLLIPLSQGFPRFFRYNMGKPSRRMCQPMPLAVCSLMYSLLLLAASCSDLTDDDGTTLPPGKYPMLFTAQVNGLTATRSATADGQWSSGDAVAVQVQQQQPGGTLEVKQYTPAGSGNSSVTLQAASGVTPFYWQTSGETKSVSAWYLGDGSAASGQSHADDVPTSWAVQSDQNASSGTGYQHSDFLYAPATDISFKPANGASNSLNFYHQTARVVINIVNADAATDAAAIQSVVIGDANNLALSGGYTAPTGAGATVGTWNTSNTGSPTVGTITPRKLTTPHTLTGGGTALATYTALVIPQQMKDKKFITVTLANGNTYYYTPTADDAANLQSGKQHTYDITVKHGYLEVASATVSSTWGGGSPEDVTGKTLSEGYAPDDLKVGDYYYSDGTTSDGGYRKYQDGTTAIMPVQPVQTDVSGNSRTVIGIVFWVGNATEKDNTLKADHSDCKHGLVVALTDASGSTAWQYPYVSVQDWLNNNKRDAFLAVQSGAGSNDPLNNIQGYNNTKAIEAFNGANSGNKVQAVETVVAYRDQVKAPGNSSDWYLPSEKELTLLCGTEVSDIWGSYSGGTANRDFINGKLSSISGAAQIVSANYWSSTERSNDHACGVYFASGLVGSGIKYGICRVRSALAF